MKKFEYCLHFMSSVDNNNDKWLEASYEDASDLAKTLKEWYLEGLSSYETLECLSSLEDYAKLLELSKSGKPLFNYYGVDIYNPFYDATGTIKVDPVIHYGRRRIYQVLYDNL